MTLDFGLWSEHWTEDTGLMTECMVECSVDVELMDFLEMVTD